MEEKIVALDVESSGTNFHKNALISLGAVSSNGEKWYKEFIPDKSSINKKSMTINNINLDSLYLNGVDIKSGLYDFCGWIKKDSIPL